MRKIITSIILFLLLIPFASSTLNPEKCSFPIQISCTDHMVNENELVLILQNAAGRTMIVDKITATSEGFGPNSVTNPCSTPNNFTWHNGERKSIRLTEGQCNYFDTGRDKNKYDLTVHYSWEANPTIKHIFMGELFASSEARRIIRIEQQESQKVWLLAIPFMFMAAGLLLFIKNKRR